MLAKKNATWVPTSQQEYDDFQKKISGHLIKRAGGAVTPAQIRDEITPDAFAEGYAEYLAYEGNPNVEVKDPEAFLVSACVNRGLNAIRSKVRRDNRFEIRPDQTEENESGQITMSSLEDAAVNDHQYLQGSSTVARAFSKERQGLIVGALSILTPGQLDAFRRVVLEDQSMADAARETGIAVKPFERRLSKATSQIAWTIAKTEEADLCDDYKAMTALMKDPTSPSRNEQIQILRHIKSCDACKAQIKESPLSIDISALLMTGAFASATAPTLGERIASTPIIETPVEIARSAWERIVPGAHGAEAAVGGTAAAGTGGTILAVGGGKALLTLCAGVATTACVAGVATGVIPVTKSNADKNNKQKTSSGQTIATEEAPAFVDTRAEYETSRASIEKTIAKRAAKRQARQKARAEARADARAAAAAAEGTPTSSGESSSSTPDQVSYTSPATSTPTTQAETNESAAAQSMGIPTAPPPAPPPPSSAQTETNQSSANDSFGFGG